MEAAADPARERSAIRGVSRNVFLLGVVSLLTDASTEMIYPLVPLFLTGTLGAAASLLGIIEGLAEATASIVKGASGWLSDRIGRRRPLVIGGYGLAAAAKPLLAFAAGWPLVLAARLLDRFGKGVRGAPRDALIADSSDPAFRGRAFGFHRSADQTGAVIGPLLALPLLNAFGQDFRAVFLAAFVPAALGVAVLLLVRETGARHVEDAARPAFRLRDASPSFRRFLTIMLLFTLGNSSDAFLILRARQAGLGPEQVVLLFAAFNLAYVLSAWPAGALADRLGKRRVIVAGLAVFSLVYLGFGLARGAPWIAGMFVAYGLYHGLTDGTIRAHLADLTQHSHRATAFGVYSMLTGLLAFPASAIAGILWDHAGPPAPFLFGAACAGASAVLLASLDRPSPRGQ